MERTLRVLDLTNDSDRDLVLSVADGQDRCRQAFIWSSNGRSLAVITLKSSGSSSISQLLLYDDIKSNLASQTLLELPSFLDLIGWLDSEHLLLAHWQPSERPAQLLTVNRQGNITLVAELQPERIECAKLSPDGRDLIYNEGSHTKRLRLDTGYKETFPVWPKYLSWLNNRRSLLISHFDNKRRVWLDSLDQPQNQILKQPGIFLSPPYQAGYTFGIIGISPDNRTLVACESAPSDNPRIRTFDSRTWLYSIPDDRWILVHTNPTQVCDQVLGWSSAGGGQ